MSEPVEEFAPRARLVTRPTTTSRAAWRSDPVLASLPQQYRFHPARGRWVSAMLASLGALVVLWCLLNFSQLRRSVSEDAVDSTVFVPGPLPSVHIVDAAQAPYLVGALLLVIAAITANLAWQTLTATAYWTVRDSGARLHRSQTTTDVDPASLYEELVEAGPGALPPTGWRRGGTRVATYVNSAVRRVVITLFADRPEGALALEPLIREGHEWTNAALLRARKR